MKLTPFQSTLYVLVSLGISVVISCAASSANELDESIVNDAQLSRKWLAASYDFDSLIYPQKDVVISLIDRLVTNDALNVSVQCSRSLVALRNGLRQRKFWAYKFIDSSGKGHAGLGHGYISDLGDHAECLSIHVSGNEPFKGQYCLVNLKFPATKKQSRNWLRAQKLNLTDVGLDGTIYGHFGNHSELFHHEHHTFALCVPSTCTRDEINGIVHKLMEGKDLVPELKPTCEVQEDMISFVSRQPFDKLVCLIFVASVLLIVIFSTLITLYYGESTVFRHFSAIRNTQKVATNYRDPYTKKIMFLDSFRFWYHTFGLFAHAFAFSFTLVPLIAGVTQDISEDIVNQWYITVIAQKSIYMTQIMFLISGMVTSYFMLPIIARYDGKVPFFLYAFKRWLRTTPTTIGVIALMFATSCFLRGPLADELLATHLGNCRKYWWKTILNVNNYDPVADICVPISWSQSVDFHLWILAYFPLIWLHKKPRQGILACISLIVLGMAIPSMVMWIYDIPSTTSGRPLDMVFFMMHGKYFPLMHLGTHNNISSYFIGILIGYMFYKEIRPNNVLVYVAIMAICYTISIPSIFGPYILTHFMGFTISRFWDIVYGGIFRVTFISMFAGAFYVLFSAMDSLQKYIPLFTGLFVNRFFVPFSRISYSVYLSQLIPMGYYFTVSYEYIPIDRYYMVFRFLSLAIVCWAFGYIVFLMFEAPFVSISRSYLIKEMAAETITVDQNKSTGDKNDNLKKME